MTFATMKFGDKSLSVDVKYGTGHQPGNFDWFPVPNNTMLNLTFVDGFTQQTLVSKTEPPPGWPTFSAYISAPRHIQHPFRTQENDALHSHAAGGTNYLIGMNQSNFTFKIVYTNDAPEGKWFNECGCTSVPFSDTKALSKKKNQKKQQQQVGSSVANVLPRQQGQLG
eukprot:SAG31_NODE_1407_length_8482_cov_11.903291_6_plen_168_part_00